MLYKYKNIYRVKKNDNNSNILKKYLIMGNEKKNKIDLAIQNDGVNNLENEFGIITYNKSFQYGKKRNIQSINDVEEPLRILVDENIFSEYQNNIKKLIVLNTKKDIDFKINSFEYLLKDFEYNASYSKYSKDDIQKRYLPLPSKYSDARTIYQNFDNSENIVDFEEKELYNWFKEHLEIRKIFFNNIVSILNNIFNENNEYYYQDKHPLRLDFNTSIGTPMHLDTCSLLIDKKYYTKDNFVNNIIIKVALSNSTPLGVDTNEDLIKIKKEMSSYGK